MDRGVSNKEPIVSVILPYYDNEAYIDEAIQSVIQQDFPLELIIVDDGSNDGGREIIKSYADSIERSNGKRIISIFQENKGVGAARNVGIAAANCELISFIDADDVWVPGKLKAQVEAISERPGTVAVVGKMQLFFDQEYWDLFKKEYSHLQEKLRVSGDGSKLYYGEPFHSYCFGSSVIRKSVIDSVGKLDETLKISDDTEFFVRLREKYLVELMELTTQLYRYRIGSLTTGKTFAERDVLRILKNSLDRRRVAGSGEVKPLL